MADINWDEIMGMPRPQYNDKFREIHLRNAQRYFELILKECGADGLDYILRTMYTNVWTMMLQMGAPQELVLRDFDFQAGQMRERILMFANGQIKPGEIGPK